MLGGMWASIWSLLVDCSREWALPLECSCSECQECKESSCSSYHATPLLLDTWGVVMDLEGAILAWAFRRAYWASIILSAWLGFAWGERFSFYWYGGAYPGVSSYSNPCIGPSWCSNTFIFSHTPWIAASWTCLNVLPSCLVVTNCEIGGRSTEFSPELSVGKLYCSTSKFSVALHLPLSLRLEVLDLVSTIFLHFSTDGVKLF